jgi:2-hydroxy-3-oxopropionate reductase
MKIGFIGLGIMGKPMSKNLIKAGHQLVVNDINQAAVDEVVAAGAVSASSAKEVGEQTSLVILMLPNSPQVKEVVLSRGGLIDGIKSGSTVIDMSSIAPAASQEVAAALAAKGVEMLDAPVSGGEPKAINGTLSIMVGGKEEVFSLFKPVLLSMGASAILCGDIGAGNTTKLANQIIVALNIAAVSEALLLGSKAGVKPDAIFQAIRGGLAGSTVLEAKAPMMIDRNFKPGFKIDLHIKDLNNAMDTAREVGVPLFLTAQVQEMLKALHNDGKGQNDHSGILEFYEQLAKTKLGE